MEYRNIPNMDTSWKISGFVCLMVLISASFTGSDILKASQCFKSRGIPKVSFDCKQNHMIKIEKAFHGIATKNLRLPSNLKECPIPSDHESNNCTNCRGDCIDDSMNLVYDWSTCMGNQSCLRTVMQSYMPACPGVDKFSDYLQVEYQCIPRDSVIDVCSNLKPRWVSEGFIMSPNYPHHYPVNANCKCTLRTDKTSHIVINLYDLLLETKEGRCRADWLMLVEKLKNDEQKHRHCGAIMTGTKNITSVSNEISLQFHTDENDNHTQSFQYFTRSLKGFWLYFTSDPGSSIEVTCSRMDTTDRDVVQIEKDDEVFIDKVNAPDDTKVSKTGPTPTSKTKNKEINQTTRKNKDTHITTKNTNGRLQGLGVTDAGSSLITLSLLTFAFSLMCHIE